MRFTIFSSISLALLFHPDFLDNVHGDCNIDKLEEVEGYYKNGILDAVSALGDVCTCTDQGQDGYLIQCASTNGYDGRFCHSFYADITNPLVSEGSCGFVTYTHSYDPNDVHQYRQIDATLRDNPVLREIQFMERRVSCAQTSTAGRFWPDDLNLDICDVEVTLAGTVCTTAECDNTIYTDVSNPEFFNVQCSLDNGNAFTRFDCPNADTSDDMYSLGAYIRKLLVYLSNTNYEWVSDTTSSSSVQQPQTPPSTPVAPASNPTPAPAIVPTVDTTTNSPPSKGPRNDEGLLITIFAALMAAVIQLLK